MFTVKLPYDIGTFVKALKENGEVDYCGTVAAYTICEDGWLVWVSGYKQAVTREYLPEEVEPMTEQEVEELVKKYEDLEKQQQKREARKVIDFAEYKRIRGK